MVLVKRSSGGLDNTTPPFGHPSSTEEGSSHFDYPGPAYHFKRVCQLLMTVIAGGSEDSSHVALTPSESALSSAACGSFGQHIPRGGTLHTAPSSETVRAATAAADKDA